MPPLVRDNYSTEPSSGEEETLPQHNQAAVPEIPNKPQAPVSKTLEMDDIFSSDDTPLPTKPAEPMTDEPPTTKRRGRPRKTIPTQPVARDVDLNEPLAPNRRTKARNFADMDIDEYQPLAPRRETRKRSTADVTESIDEDEDGPLPPRRRSGKKPLAGSSTGSFEKDKASTPRDDASYIPNTWKYAVVVPVRKRIKSTGMLSYVVLLGFANCFY